MAAPGVILATALVIAGCGAAGANGGGPAVAAKLLSSSNSAAMGTSFQVVFDMKLSASAVGLSGLPAATEQQIQKAASSLNGVDVKGTLEFQSPTTFEMTYTMAPLAPQEIYLLRAGGGSYISTNGRQWYSLAAVAGSGAGVPAPSKLSNLKSQLLQIGKAAKAASHVTNLGDSKLNGVTVDHLRATVTGAGLDSVMGQALAGAATSSASGGASLAVLDQMLRFGTTTADSWVAVASHLPQRVSATSSVKLDLGALGALLGGASGTKVSGSISMGGTFTANFSRYGADFGLAKPTSVLPGAPQLPSSLSQLA